MPPTSGECPLPPSSITEEFSASDRAIAARDAEILQAEASNQRRLIDLMKKAEFLDPEQLSEDIIANKELRRDLDALLQKLKGLRGSRHRSLAITHLEDVIMRLGMDLKRLNEMSPTPEPRPYPSSYDPSNTKVEPTADGLKL